MGRPSKAILSHSLFFACIPAETLRRMPTAISVRKLQRKTASNPSPVQEETKVQPLLCIGIPVLPGTRHEPFSLCCTKRKLI